MRTDTPSKPSRLYRAWRRLTRQPIHEYFDANNEFLGIDDKQMLAPSTPTRRSFIAALGATTLGGLTTIPNNLSDNSTDLEDMRDRLKEATAFIRPLILRASNISQNFQNSGTASGCIIDVQRGLLTLSAHQGAVGEWVTLWPDEDHPVKGITLHAQITFAGKAPNGSGHDIALAQIHMNDAYTRYKQSVDGFVSPKLPRLTPNDVRDQNRPLFVAGYPDYASTVQVSPAIFADNGGPLDVYLSEGRLVNACSYELQLQNSLVGRPGISGGVVFELTADGDVVLHGIVHTVYLDNSGKISFSPPSLLNDALLGHGLYGGPEGASETCRPKPLDRLQPTNTPAVRLHTHVTSRPRTRLP